MDEHFVKTELGREEIRRRSRSLPRTARNLLLIVDGTRRASDWMSLVQGATRDDLLRLLEGGLVEPDADPPEPTPTPSTSPACGSFSDTVLHADPDALYGIMVAQAVERLGLIRGYAFVLEVERCTNGDAVRSLYARFVRLVRTRQGDAAARDLRDLLGGTARLQAQPV